MKTRKMKPPGRHYRVVKRLPWIEGGKTVVYEPGHTMYVEDQEVEGISDCLEALDDAGRAILEAARARAEAPAEITFIDDLHPRTVEWLTRSLDEKLRAAGSMRQLVLSMLARGEDPTDDDLAAALEESPHEPLPQELRAYLVEMLHGRVWRKSGRKTPPRTTAEDLFIQWCYHFTVEDLQERFSHQKRAATRRMAKEKIADALGLGVRTVERIVAPRPWTKTKSRKT